VSNQLPDHPVIRNLQATGYPDGIYPEIPHCPICDEECDTVYTNLYGEIVGCDECIGTANAWEVLCDE